MNSAPSSGPSQTDYEERNRVSSFRGYLYKLRRSQNLLAPQWGKRWFSIEGHFMKWYRHEQDLCSSGMVDLKYIRSIHKLENSAYGNYTFLINCEERNLILRCTTSNEMNQWVRALHIQADIARGGTGMNVVSDFNQMPLNYSQLKSRRQGKLRSSMSLEQELDFHLKKLNELEQEILSNASEPDSKHTSVKKTKKFDDGEDRDFEVSGGTPGDDDDEDELSTKKSKRGSKRLENHSSSSGNKLSANPISNVTASPSRTNHGKSTSSNTATATTSSSAVASTRLTRRNNESSESNDEEDSYDFDDAVVVRAPVKRAEDTRSSSSAASRVMERMESIEDIQLVPTKVSRSKQYLKEQQQHRSTGGKSQSQQHHEADFDNLIKHASTESHEDEFDFEEIVPGSKSSSSASAAALYLPPTNTSSSSNNNHNNNNYSNNHHKAATSTNTTTFTKDNHASSSSTAADANRRSLERTRDANTDKEDSVRSSRSRATKSAWD
jgi:hypothetical protein